MSYAVPWIHFCSLRACAAVLLSLLSLRLCCTFFPLLFLQYPLLWPDDLNYLLQALLECCYKLLTVTANEVKLMSELQTCSVCWQTSSPKWRLSTFFCWTFLSICWISTLYFWICVSFSCTAVEAVHCFSQGQLSTSSSFAFSDCCSRSWFCCCSSLGSSDCVCVLLRNV